MRLLLTLAILGIVACASQREGPPTAPSAATHTVAAGTPVQPVAAVAAPQAEAKIKAPSGYTAVERHGQVLYCQKVKVTGTNIANEVCITPAEYDQQQGQTDSDRQRIRQMGTICAGGKCGGG